MGDGEKSNILDEHLDLDDKEDDLDEVGRQETETKDEDNAGSQDGDVKQEAAPKEEKMDDRKTGMGFPGLSGEAGASNRQQSSQQQEQQQQQLRTQQQQQLQGQGQPGQQQHMQQPLPQQMPKMPHAFEARPPLGVGPPNAFAMAAGQHPGLRGMRPPPPYTGGAGPMAGVRMMGAMPGATLSHLRGSLAGVRPPSVPMPGGPLGGPLGGAGLVGSAGEQRPLLLQEQPLLLEDLVEQEKREQRKQSGEAATATLLSDVDFERLKADVLSGPPDDTIGAPAPVMPPQASLLPSMQQQHPVSGYWGRCRSEALGQITIVHVCCSSNG